MPEVRYQKTTLSRHEAEVALEEAFRRRFARGPTRNELMTLLAHSEHETNGWANMPNYNWGGVKAFKKWAENPANSFVLLLTTEGSGAEAKRVRQPFRAYPTAKAGAFDWLSALAHGWPSALVQAGRSNVAEYVRCLVKEGVKGAYFTGSQSEYETAMRRNFTRWHAELPADTFPAAEEPTLPAASLPSPVQTWPEGTYVTVAGYHRAKQFEVTAEMTAAAVAAVTEMRLGEIRYLRGFALGCETHSNAAKGISVFLPDVGALEQVSK